MDKNTGRKIISMGMLKVGGEICVIAGVLAMFVPFVANFTGLAAGPIVIVSGSFSLLSALPFFVTGAILLFLGLFMVALEKL
jgi:hypothetical protein